MSNPLKVLQESVIQGLEGGVKGSKVPAFHAYVDGPDDVVAEKIPQLKEDFLQIYRAFYAGLALTEEKVVISVPLHDTGYNPLFGMPVDKDAREVIAHCLNEVIDQCTLAILANCGFGKFSAPPEKIREAQKQLCESIETIYLPLPEELLELNIFAYDSNANPKHGFLVDGMWVPYRAVGLIRYEAKDIILAFQATMDYGSGEWKIDRFDTDFLSELAEKSSLFADAYRKIAGRDFDNTVVAEASPGLVEFIKSSPYFQPDLNRICARWTIR